MKKDLTSIADLTPADVGAITQLAAELKRQHDGGERISEQLRGKVVALIFEKPSLRTKVSFEVAATSLGATPVFLSSSQILASGQNESGRESIPDIARNLERFCDLIVARVYRHEVILGIASAVKTPVINALCDRHHPTQALADLMAIEWHLKGVRGKRVAFIGDGNNVATSLMQVVCIAGGNFVIAAPRGFEPPPREVELAQSFAAKSGGSVTVLADPTVAAKNADVLYTDTFVSMGQEQEKAERIRAFTGYQVNRNLMSLARPQAVFMHCLPAHRGEEVTDEVMDSPASIVFDQAECRLHIAKALLLTLLHSAPGRPSLPNQR